LPFGYRQSSTDDFEWLVLTGPTPSKNGPSPDVTGPSGDNTSGSDNYIYVEASGTNSPSKVTTFETPKININTINNPSLSFYYHMFSDTNAMGSLSLDISVDGVWENEILNLDNDNYGDKWNLHEIDLSSYNPTSWIKFRFNATTGSIWASDIALDDISVTGTAVSINKMENSSKQLSLNYFNSSFHFSIPEAMKYKNISLSIYNIQGKEVYKSTIKSSATKGIINTNQIKLASGIYSSKLSVEKLETSATLLIIN
jgi:hypothetical protein